jgi:peptidoglycan hydrolase FlgJ
MTPLTIGSLTPGQQKPDATAATPEQRKAARDFEAIFLRQMLSTLEKGSSVSGSQSSGGAVFRSMMVSALADTAAEGGGIGLSEVILKAMLPPTPQGKPDLSSQAPPFQDGATPAAGFPMERQRLTSGVLPARSARLGVAGPSMTSAHPPVDAAESVKVLLPHGELDGEPL